MGFDTSFNTSSANKLTMSDIMRNWDLSSEENSAVRSIFQASQLDDDKQTISGEDEWRTFRSGIIAKFKDTANSILRKLGLPEMSDAESEQLDSIKQAETEKKAARQEAIKNPGALPPKTPDGRLSPEQVQEYIENTPGTHVLREIIDNSEDFTETTMRKHDLERFEKVLASWKDTPEGEEIPFIKIGSVQFTHVKKATLPDGTKVFYTAEGCYQLAANGFPGKELDAEALAKHGVEE